MLTPLSSRFTSALIGLLLFLSFTSAQAADTLGAWKAQNPSSSTYKINGMAFGNNTYVIVGYDSSKCCKNNFVATSFDAINWTVRNTGSTSSEFNSVIFSKGRFIAVCKQPDTGNARIWISDTNGATWVTKSSDNAGMIVEGGLHAVASDGNGKLVAVGGTKTGSYGWMTISNDNGSTWRIVRWSTNGDAWYTTNKLYGIGYGKGNWYAFNSLVTYKSSDGGALNTSWPSYPSLDGVDTTGLGSKVASSKTTVVVASSAGPKWSKDEGATWHLGTQAKGFEGVSTLTSSGSSVIYEDGIFVLSITAGGDIWTSETGQTWKRWTLPTASDTYTLCYGKKTFWCAGADSKISKSPPWFKARLGCSTDYPFTLFDAEDGPPNRIGLPQYRVNTASLNLVLEGTLFYAKTLGTPINLKLIYNSKPTADGDSTIGPFGKNWRFRYESIVGRFGQDAQLVNGGGRSFAFTTPNGEELDSEGGDLTLTPPDGIYDTLVYHGGGPSFELTLKSSHLTYIYGEAGTGDKAGLFYLSEIKDQFGNTTALTYLPAGSGQISTIKDPALRTFTFAYTSGLCDGISMPDGRSVSFTYDANKNLTKIKDMMLYEGTYAYDTKGFLLSMSTNGTKTTTFGYEPRPGYEDAGCENEGDQYLSSLTRPAGGKTKYELMDEGNTIKRTSPSGEITLISNKDGQTTSVKDPLGNVSTTTFNDAKLPSSVTDEKGGVYTYEYDPSGNMTKQTDALGKATTYTYDSYNNITSITNASGKTWTYTYNQPKYQPLTTTTPLGNVTTLTYFSGGTNNGRMATMKDARDNITSFAYDTNKCGNLLTTARPAGGGVTTLAYDGQGFRCTSMTDPNGNTKTLAWDANDRLTSIIYNTAGGVSYTNTYNAFGQDSFINELGKSSTVTRDELGFITSLTDPLGHVTQTEYDADSRPSKTIDPLGRATSSSYDNAGRPILFTDARGFKIVQEYDSTGNLVSFKDKNGAETKYAYDKNNRLLTTTDPLKKIITITRDEIGKVSSLKNARLQTISYEYDADGRLKKKTGKLTATGTPTTLIENTLIDKNGNIQTQTDPWGTTEYVYDANNRIEKITYPDGHVDLTYNNGGNIATIAYPNGLVATYTYDTFNRQTVPSILKNNPGTEIAGESRSTNAVKTVTLSVTATGTFTLDYNDRGKITKVTRPNSTTTSDYTYDDAGRITKIVHGGAVDFTVECTPDAVGNLSSESFSGATYYSSAQTLTPATTALLYNVAGGLTKKGAQACISDADGNLTDLGAGTVKCTYDFENRLTKMVRKSGTTLTTTDNTYNANGLRVKKAVAGGDTVVYHYLPSGILLFTTDGSGAVLDTHVFAGATLLATYKETEAKLIFYYGDMQGNVRFIADDTGIPLVQYDYLPYGQVNTKKLAVNNPLIDKNPFTMNGLLGVQDEGNGIFCMGKRFYEAASARFLSRDPLGFDAGPNLYAFGKANPILYADPTGMKPKTVVPNANKEMETAIETIAKTNPNLAADLKKKVIVDTSFTESGKIEFNLFGDNKMRINPFCQTSQEDLVDTLKHEAEHDKQYGSVFTTGWNVLRRFVETPANMVSNIAANAVEGVDLIGEDDHWDPMEKEAYEAQEK
ncbi:MAG: RHS repeat-associated core domain-containing protein [Victivallales bacterium]